MYILGKYKWSLYVFAGPAFCLYTYFIFFSIFKSFYYSFTEWDAISPSIFNGLNNYRLLFNDPDFRIVMLNTIKGLVISLVVQLTLGLFFAYLVYRTRRGFRTYRALVFLPVVLSAAAVALMFSLIFNSESGPVNELLRMVGLDSWTRNWLSDSSVVYYTVLTPMMYQYIGLYIIIFLAGMQSISTEVLESSSIDGASSFQTFFQIVIPMQIEIILISTILITTGLFKAFEHSYIMTWGGPGVRSAFLGVFMYITTFLEANFGMGSAIAMLILVLSLIFTLIFRSISNRLNY